MSVRLLLIILLVILFFGAYPGFGYHTYGYAPMGGLGLILLVVVVVALLGRGE